MKQILAALPALALAACYPAPPPAPPITPNPPGGVYRALGTEPFWSMTIDDRRIVFTEANAPGVEIVEPTPRVIGGFAGEIYQTPRIGVNIVHTQCSDGMSDRVYPDRVQVTVDGRRLDGCGGAAVTPTSLAGTNWRVLAVNGRPTPAQGEFFMNFQADRFGAKFGCNGMGAEYRQQGDTIIPAQVMGTKMACPDMSFENDAGVVLSQPLRMQWQDGDRLRLSSGPMRTIDLARSY